MNLDLLSQACTLKESIAKVLVQLAKRLSEQHLNKVRKNTSTLMPVMQAILLES